MEEQKGSTQTVEQLNNLDEISKELDRAVVELDKRLSIVLRDRQSKDKVDEKPIAELVKLADSIRSTSWTARNALNNVLSILERLEL